MTKTKIKMIIELFYICLYFIGLSIIYFLSKRNKYSKINHLKFAFGHQKRVGKDEACKYLKKKYNGEIISFSASIYKILNFSFNEMNMKYEKDRDFLRFIGMWGRSRDPAVWIKSSFRNIECNDDTNLFVSDVRFKNEFDFLKKKGFILVKIERQTSDIDSHISETELQDVDWDVVIKNDSDLQSFYRKLDKLIFR